MRSLIFLVAFIIGPDAWPDAILGPDAPPIKTAEVQVTAEVRTAAEKAQDDAYLQEHHWRLSAGSCGMLGCSVHGGGWVLDRAASQGPAQYPGAQRPRGPESPAVGGPSPSQRRQSGGDCGSTPSGDSQPKGHWETRRVGLFRTRSVWVADPEATELPRRETDKAPAPATSPGAACPPGGT